MSHNALSLKPLMRNKFGSTSTNASSQVPAEQQLQTYADHYGGKWVGKNRDFVNIPIYTYESLGSIWHIMVGRLAQLSTDTTTAKQPWLELYEKRCELEVYCWWHRLWVSRAWSVELPRDEPTNILAHLERENNQMQRWLDRFRSSKRLGNIYQGRRKSEPSSLLMKLLL